MSKISKNFDVIGLGGCAWDILGIVDEYPQVDEKKPLVAFEQQGGGQAGTAMVAAARLGGTTAIIGTTGDDELGEKIKRGFVDEGVDTSHLHTLSGVPSHLAICITVAGTGQRTIFYRDETKGQLDPQQLERDFITSARCFLTDTHQPQAGLVAARWAKAAGIPVVLDLERDAPISEKLLQVGDYPILPASYALELTGENTLGAAAQKLLAYQPTVLIITRGAEGAVAYTDQEVIEQPAFEVEPVVDTTGAGDVFHGAFAYGLALGYDLRQNLAFASAAAALNCRRLGGRGSLPSVEEVKQFMDREQRTARK